MTKYDDVGWHIEAALEAGQPEEHAATHIGLFLAWIIRHDLHDPEMFPRPLIAAVKSGELSGSQVLLDQDGKLVADELNADGAGFADWYYAEQYLTDYAVAFQDVPDYGVADDALANEKIASVIDGRFVEWIQAGRLARASAPADNDADVAIPDVPIVSSDELGRRRQVRWESALADASGGNPEILAELQALTDKVNAGAALDWGNAKPEPNWDDLKPQQSGGPHLFPRLEALLPSGFLETRSVSLLTHGSSLQILAAKRLGVDPSGIGVAMAFQKGDHPGDIGGMVTLFGIPGQPAEALGREFNTAFSAPARQLIEERPKKIAGRTVHWARGSYWVQGWWVRDELVVFVTAPDQPSLDRLIGLIP